MTPIKQMRKLVVRITKLFKAVFPQTHILEFGKCFVKRFNPIGAENVAMKILMKQIPSVKLPAESYYEKHPSNVC